MSTPILIKQPRSSALDILRFLAVAFVFLAHYTDTFNRVYQIVPLNLKYTVVSRYASVALLVFFIVSGYVVTMTSIKRTLKDFIITRFSRIYPLFWISCLAAFLIPKFIHTHSYLGNNSFKTFLVNLTMLPSLFGYQMINPVFHTLLIEIAFYIFIGLIIGFKLWKHIILVLAVVIAICIINMVFSPIPFYLVIIPFTSGMLFYFIHVKYASAWKLYLLLFLNFVCALSGAKPLAQELDLSYNEPGSHSVWVIAIVITIVYMLFWLIALKKVNIGYNKFSQILGEVAYPFYLFHVYFLYFYWYFSTIIQSDLLLLCIFCITLISSWMLNIFVEKPLSKLAAHIFKLFFSPFNRHDEKRSSL